MFRSKRALSPDSERRLQPSLRAGPGSRNAYVMPSGRASPLAGKEVQMLLLLVVIVLILLLLGGLWGVRRRS